MSIGTIMSNVTRLNRDLADLQKKLAEEKKKESNNLSKITQIERSITKNTSGSMLTSKLNQISRLRNDIAKSSVKQADFSKKIASKTADLNKYNQQLNREQLNEQKKREREQLEYQKKLSQELAAQKSMVLQAVPTVSSPEFLEDEEQPQFDVFISHASEDKDDFVRPLAEELIRIGVKVWYDEFSLRWGDSLRVSIDKGLANSKFGVVVISSSFISKKWPEYEVNGMVAREMNGEKVILPIWHKVSKSEVMKYSPTLADKLAMNSSMDEIEDIASRLKDLLN